MQALNLIRSHSPSHSSWFAQCDEPRLRPGTLKPEGGGRMIASTLISTSVVRSAARLLGYAKPRIGTTLAWGSAGYHPHQVAGVVAEARERGKTFSVVRRRQ